MAVDDEAPGVPKNVYVYQGAAYKNQGIWLTAEQHAAVWRSENDRIAKAHAKGAEVTHRLLKQRSAELRQLFLERARARPTALIRELEAELGVTHSWYDHQRLRQPDFKRAFDEIRYGVHRMPVQGFEKFRMDYFGRRTWPHQKLIVEAIEKAKPDDVILILMPPEAGKTSVLEEYCAYRICMDPAVRIQYMSQSPGEASKRINQIKAYLTEPSATKGADGTPGKILGAYGPFYDRDPRNIRPWTADYFTVAKAPLMNRDFTLEARGVLSNIQGTRADLFIIDDPQDLKTIRRSKDILQKIRQEASTRLTDKGIMVWAATRVDVNDVYDLLFTMEEEEFFVDKILEVSAINSKGESFCEEMWPHERLMRKKQKVGKETWARCYMQRPLMAGAFTFSSENMDAAKNRHVTAGQMEPGMPGVLTIDPGLNPGVCAFLVSSIVDEKKLRLVEYTSYASFSGINDITNEMERLLIAYPGITDLTVETNNFQKAIEADDRFVALVRANRLSVHQHKTTGKNKDDHDLGISALGRGYWRGEIEIPDASVVDRAMFKPLIEQHIRWSPGIPDKISKQDAVIVTWMAWKMLAEIRNQLERDRKRNIEDWRRHQSTGWGKVQRVG